MARAEHENWGYQRLLQHLCESEEQDRRERKMQRLLKESGLPAGKTLGSLDEKLVPAKIRRLLPTLLEGHFVERAENVLALGLPGRGKTHFLAVVGRELILRRRCPVLLTPTFKLVQQLFQPLLGGVDAFGGFAHPLLPAQELQVQQPLDLAQVRFQTAVEAGLDQLDLPPGPGGFPLRPQQPEFPGPDAGLIHGEQVGLDELHQLLRLGQQARQFLAEQIVLIHQALHFGMKLNLAGVHLSQSLMFSVVRWLLAGGCPELFQQRPCVKRLERRVELTAQQRRVNVPRPAR